MEVIKINVLSLFDGISTGRLCLDKAKIKVDHYYSSEINPQAIKISEKNYPNIIRLGDVEKIDVHNLPYIDLVIGGSPCQGFSRAGMGLNFKDSRSKLFFEYMRILNEIKSYNPNVKFLLENVVMKKEWAKVITDNIGVAPVIINSKILSPQSRPRMYWTNIAISPIENTHSKLIDILETVDTSDYIKQNGVLFDPKIREECRNLVKREANEVRISQATKLGYIVAENGDGVNLDFPTSKSRRGRVIKKKSACLTTSTNPLVYVDGCIRRLTIKERERDFKDYRMIIQTPESLTVRE